MTRILIVDDIEQNRYLLESILKGNGFLVTSVKNGAEALDAAKRDLPDLIITDILMPVMDGFELCRQWKADDRLKRVPIIFYTATYTDPEAERLAYNLGADRFMVKPQRPDVLVKEIREVLSEYRQQPVKSPAAPRRDEKEILVQYNEVLFKKLEKKVIELEADIARSKAAEKALRDEQEFTHLLLDTLPTYYVAIGTDGRTITMNRALLDALGYTLEEVQGKDYLTTFVPAEDREDLTRVFEEITVEGKATTSVNRVISKSGNSFIVEWHGRPVKQGAGKPDFFVGIGIDVTECRRAEDALKRSEERYRNIVQSQTEFICRFLPDGTHLFANEAYCTYFNKRCNEIIGHRFRPEIPPEDRPVLTQFFASITPDNPVGTVQHRIIMPGGEIRWQQWTDRGIFDRRGVLTEYQSVGRDITDRRKAEEALRESEAKYREFFTTSRDCVFITSPDGRWIDFNNAALEMFGYGSRDELMPVPITSLYERSEERPVFLKKIVQEGFIKEFPVQLRKKDGTIIDTLITAIPVREADGSVKVLVGTIRDVTDRKRAEEELRRSEAQLRLALEGADAALWDLHLPEGKGFFSDRFFTMCGYQPGEFPTTYNAWLELVHPEDQDRMVASQMQQIEEKVPVLELEFRFRAKDGTWRWILARGKVVNMDPEGNAVHVTGVALDITGRKLMESEIRALNATLEERVKERTLELQKTNESLQEEVNQRLEAENKLRASLDEKVMLVKEIHHRVKNNLQIIVSLLNLQARSITDEATLSVIRDSQSRVKAMALVHEKLYKAENIERIDLRDYLRFLGTGLFQSYGAKAQGVTFKTDITGVEVGISSAIPLGLIVNELITNSLKYAFPDGRPGEIEVSVRKDAHLLNVRFRDNGIGIPETLDWRNAPSLGLRLVNTLVDQLDGTIELDRTAGTSFTMVLHEKD